MSLLKTLQYFDCSSNKSNRTDQGFTLVEMLVTIIIMLMIAAVISMGTTVASISMEDLNTQSNSEILTSTLNNTLTNIFNQATDITLSNTDAAKGEGQIVSFVYNGNICTLSIPTDSNTPDNLRGHIVLNYTDTNSNAVTENIVDPGTYLGLTVAPSSEDWLLYSTGSQLTTGNVQAAYNIFDKNNKQINLTECLFITPILQVPESVIISQSPTPPEAEPETGDTYAFEYHDTHGNKDDDYYQVYYYDAGTLIPLKIGSPSWAFWNPHYLLFKNKKKVVVIDTYKLIANKNVNATVDTSPWGQIIKGRQWNKI